MEVQVQDSPGTYYLSLIKYMNCEDASSNVLPVWNWSLRAGHDYSNNSDHNIARPHQKMLCKYKNDIPSVEASQQKDKTKQWEKINKEDD